MAEDCLTRKLIAGLSVLGVLSVALLPPEHVHFTRSDDGHHSDIIHRHFESHHPIAAEASVGHEDDDVLWLDESSFTSPKLPPHIYPFDRFLYESLPVPPPQPASRWMPRAIHVSVHGPPWATPHGLRAPPLLSPDLI